MFLAVFIPALVGALAGAVGSLLGRALIALGIGFVTYKGMDVALGAIKTQIISGVGGLPADAVGLLGYLWVDKGISIIFSAVGVALTMRGLTSSVKRVVLK